MTFEITPVGMVHNHRTDVQHTVTHLMPNYFQP